MTQTTRSLSNSSRRPFVRDTCTTTLNPVTGRTFQKVSKSWQEDCSYTGRKTAHLASIVELQPLNIVLSEQHPRSLALPDLPSDRAQLLVERRRLLALALPLVEHLREGLEGGEGQLEGHPVTVARWRLLQQVLEEEDELGEALDWLHHQTKEVQTVVGSDLLHLRKMVLIFTRHHYLDKLSSSAHAAG